MAGPTREQVNLWYESFVQLLKSMGISNNNPLSLGLVKIYNDIDYKRFNQLVRSNDLEDNQAAIDLGKTVLKAPFLKSDQEYTGDDYADFMTKNMANTDELTDDQKLMLYNAAMENKLIIESFDAGTDYSFNDRYVKVDPEGKAFVTQPFSKIFLENCEENGFKREEFEEIDMLHGKRANMVKDTRGIIQNMINDLHNSIAFLPPDRRKIAAKQVEEQKIQIETRNQWVRCEHDIISEAKKHPSWYQSEETRHIRNEVRRLAGRSGLTSEQKDLIAEHNVIDINIDKSLMKFTGAKTWSELYDITFREKGGAKIDTTNEYRFYKNFCGSLFRDDYVYINGKPCYNTAGGYGFKECAAKDAYAREVDELIAELAETDSKLSNDTQSYKDFKRELTELSKNIRNAKDINMEYDKLNALFDKATSFGTAYQTAHQDKKELSSRQRARLRVINKLNVLQEKLKAKRIDPKPTVEERIMEKLVHGAFVSAQKSRDEAKIAFGVRGQLNYNNYTNIWRELQEGQAFKHIRNLSPVEKEKLAVMRTKDLTREFLKIASKTQEKVHAQQDKSNEISNEQPQIINNLH